MVGENRVSCLKYFPKGEKGGRIVEEMIKVIVAGGRDFSDYDLLKQTLNRLLMYKLPNVEIVCGKARGADTLGECYAKELGLPIAYFPADWDQFGKAAGYIRNKEMAKYADACVIFWDGQSKGSKHMYDLALKEGIPTRIVRY